MLGIYLENLKLFETLRIIFKLILFAILKVVVNWFDLPFDEGSEL